MKSIYNRTSFYDKNVIDNITEYDLGSMNTFPNTDVSYFMIKSNESGRPDIFSKRVYGDDKYWWLICSFNGLMDPIHQFVENTVLKCPSISYFQSFAKNNNK